MAADDCCTEPEELARFDIVSVDTPDGGPAEERMAFTMNPVGLTMRLREAA